MEFLQSKKFIIKHKKGTNNKVGNYFSRRLLTVQEVKLQSIGIDEFKDLYVEDIDFAKVHKVCSNFENHFHSKFSEFTLHNGLLFKEK